MARVMVFALVLLVGCAPARTISTQAEAGLDNGLYAATQCSPGEGVVGTGIPDPIEDRRHEDIIFHLTGHRDEDYPEGTDFTIEHPNYGGVYGDFEDGIVVAVLDCSLVDVDELARIAGGADLLRLIEVPYTYEQINTWKRILATELEKVDIPSADDGFTVVAGVGVDSTLQGRVITVELPDRSLLPDNFGASVPPDAFQIRDKNSPPKPTPPPLWAEPTPTS